MSKLQDVLNLIDANQPQALERLCSLLRIKSISTDSEYADDCAKAADWLVEDLNSIGFDAQRHDTPGHPMVVAKLFSDENKPHYLFYGHYDVQPVDPLPSLIPFMQDNVELLKADIAMVCDTGMWDQNTPAISTMLRGMVGEQFTITGPSLDLHSGMYGGPAINPIRVMNKILAGLHDETGRITLKDFYDGVTEPASQVKQQWAELNHDEQDFLGSVGLSKPAGEDGYTVLEQIWSRPTCDVNGIWGGYTGEGFKTVLPSKASAKISFRLVGEQDPDKIQQTFQQYVRDNLPPDCSVEFHSKDASAATIMPIDAPEFARTHAALSEEWENNAVYAGCGGSIPVVGHIKSILQMDSLLVGFGLDDDAIHSPNEKYNLRSFHKGTRSWARILAALVD